MQYCIVTYCTVCVVYCSTVATSMTAPTTLNVVDLVNGRFRMSAVIGWGTLRESTDHGNTRVPGSSYYSTIITVQIRTVYTRLLGSRLQMHPLLYSNCRVYTVITVPAPEAPPTLLFFYTVIRFLAQQAPITR